MTMITGVEHVQEVAENIYRVRLPLPFALNHVNSYLLREPDGWTLVDAGLNRPELQELWQAAWRELGVAPRTIRRIILTHMHPDHFGLAGWLQEQSGAPVFLSPRESEVARVTWIEEMTAPRHALVAAYLHSAGVAADVATVITRQQDYLRSLTYPHPQEILTIAPGEVITIGSRRFQAIHAPGHADGQLIFYSAADRLLLTGDQVLLRITPNIGVWPSTQGEPLAAYLDSLAELGKLDVGLALPGHHGPITSWQDRIAELVLHHSHRLETMLAAVEDGATALEVSYRVFNYDRFSTHEVRFAVAETLAHLEHLASQGRLIRVEEADQRLYMLPAK